MVNKTVSVVTLCDASMSTGVACFVAEQSRAQQGRSHTCTHTLTHNKEKYPKKEVDWVSERQNPFEVSSTVAVMRNTVRLVPASCADVAYKIVHTMRSAERLVACVPAS